MSSDATVIGAVLLLAVGTLALRLTGPLLRARVELSPQLQALIDRAVAVLFCALIATSTLLQDGHHAGVARLLGFSSRAFWPGDGRPSSWSWWPPPAPRRPCACLAPPDATTAQPRSRIVLWDKIVISGAAGCRATQRCENRVAYR